MVSNAYCFGRDAADYSNIQTTPIDSNKWYINVNMNDFLTPQDLYQVGSSHKNNNYSLTSLLTKEEKTGFAQFIPSTTYQDSNL